MLFPDNIKWDVPEKGHPGAFGAVRFYDRHTGVDLYVPDGTPVYSLEDCRIVDVSYFTGPNANPPCDWWEETWSVTVQNNGSNNYLLYGELTPTVFKDDIIEAGIKYVIRPDSGNPVDTLRRLFITLRGYNVLVLNGKGYYELPDWLGVLQGDGIEYLTITAILKMLAQEGFSTKGLVLGMGGKLLQSHSRDDFGFAMKCSYAIVDGKPVNVFKDPITDPGKRSKMGRLKLVRFKGNLGTVSDTEDGNWDSYVDELQIKYSKINHQVVVNKDTFESVRQRIANNI